MNRFLYVAAFSLIFSACSNQNSIEDEAQYIVTASTTGTLITYLNPDGKSESIELLENEFSLVFDAESDDLLEIQAQSKNENTCVIAYIVFAGDTVATSTPCGNYVNAYALFRVPFKKEYKSAYNR